MKKLNKKGFTLVELLAVIVVLSVIMLLAVNAVLPRMNSARKNAFVTEAQTYMKAAETYYQEEILAGNAAPTCVNIGKVDGKKSLTGEYVSKDNAAYSGKIEITTNSSTGVVTYKIYISNGEYSIEGQTSADLAAGVSAIDDSYDVQPNDCP